MTLKKAILKIWMSLKYKFFDIRLQKAQPKSFLKLQVRIKNIIRMVNKYYSFISDGNYMFKVNNS